MSRRTIVRRPQRRAVFVPLWLKRIRMAPELKALDRPQATIYVQGRPLVDDLALTVLVAHINDYLAGTGRVLVFDPVEDGRVDSALLPDVPAARALYDGVPITDLPGGRFIDPPVRLHD